MSDESKSYIGIVAAISREVAPLIRRFKVGGRRRSISPDQSIKLDVHEISLQGSLCLTAAAGIGEENAFNAANTLARNYPLKGLISLGFAGGLVTGLAPGTVVSCTEIIDQKSGARYPCNADLLKTTSGIRGGLLCADEVVASSIEKQALGRKWNASSVDMESAGVARAAQLAGLPFGAIKAISDSAEQSLSIDFTRCRREYKGYSVWAILRQAMGSREAARGLFILAKNSRKAAEALANAFSND